MKVPCVCRCVHVCARGNKTSTTASIRNSDWDESCMYVVCLCACVLSSEVRDTHASSVYSPTWLLLRATECLPRNRLVFSGAALMQWRTLAFKCIKPNMPAYLPLPICMLLLCHNSCLSCTWTGKIFSRRVSREQAGRLSCFLLNLRAVVCHPIWHARTKLMFVAHVKEERKRWAEEDKDEPRRGKVQGDRWVQ
jgi:hypothetical protein